MTAIVLGVLLTAPPPKTEPAADRELLALWADLVDVKQADEAKTTRTLLKLAGHKDAVPFLKAKLVPLKLDAARANELLAKLGSDDETEWKPAYDELHYFDPRLALDLEALMDLDAAKAELPRARLVSLLSGDRDPDMLLKQGKPLKLNKHKDGARTYFNFFCDGSWWAEAEVEKLNVGTWGNRKPYWTRAVRAIAVLEHLGTPDAVAVLKAMAGGHPDAQPTKAAKDAVERLAKAR